MTFFAYFLSLSMLFSWCIPAVACVRASFLITVEYFSLYGHSTFAIHSLADGHVSGFKTLALENSTLHFFRCL